MTYEILGSSVSFLYALSFSLGFRGLLYHLSYITNARGEQPIRYGKRAHFTTSEAPKIYVPIFSVS